MTTEKSSESKYYVVDASGRTVCSCGPLFVAAPDLLNNSQYFDYAAERLGSLDQYEDDEIVQIEVTIKALKDNRNAINKALGND